PAAHRSGATGGRCRASGPTTWPPPSCGRCSSATRRCRPTPWRTSSSATPTRPARTTATWHAWPPSWPATPSRSAAPPSTAFAPESHRRAVAAQQAGAFDAELVPVTPPGEPAVPVTADEGPRPDTTMEKLARLKPAFVEGGTVTAGNSSPLNDGAAAVLLATEDGLAAHGLEPMARVVTWGAAGVQRPRMEVGAVPALN